MKTPRLLSLVALLAVLAPAGFAQQTAPASPPAASAQPPARPPVNHDFDFWAGDWEVFSRDGRLIGLNKVELVAGGYGLLENWAAVGATQNGKSLNSYNPATGQWQQYWVGSGGQTAEYKGGLVDGKMVMIAESVTPRGAKYLTRGTWTPNPDGTVRQQFEISTDEGKTWQGTFDGLYRRKS